MDKSSLKKKAAEKAVEQIESGMVVGLGSGSTAIIAVKLLAELLQKGELHDITGIPTSKWTEAHAREWGIPISSLNEYPKIDLTIDGADEVDERLNVIKGGGGAHLREKVIAQATEKEIIIVDDSKISKYLGEKWSVPVEVLQMALEPEIKFLYSIDGKPVLRKSESGGSFISDEGNFIVDVNFGIIKEPERLSAVLSNRAGIVEHGLFIGLVDEVIVASEEGIKTLLKPPG